MTDDAKTTALLRQLDDRTRRDLIDACIQAAASGNVLNDRIGRMVKLAAMIGEPVGGEEHNAVVNEIADWWESGTGEGNRVLAERIRSKFLRR